MKKLSCIILAVFLLCCTGVPGALAVCYRQCQRSDTQQPCYVSESDCPRGCIYDDADGDGKCDGCADKLCFTDEDGDGRCDLQGENPNCEQKNQTKRNGCSRQQMGRGCRRGSGNRFCQK